MLYSSNQLPSQYEEKDGTNYRDCWDGRRGDMSVVLKFEGESGSGRGDVGAGVDVGV